MNTRAIVVMQLVLIVFLLLLGGLQEATIQGQRKTIHNLRVFSESRCGGMAQR